MLYMRLNLHVSASDLDVVRACWCKLSKLGKSRERRTDRHEYMRLMIADHHDAQDLYRDVVTGRI